MAFSLNEMDDVTKFMFIILVGVVVYLIAVLLLKPLIIPSDTTPSHSMVMGDHMMNFTNKDSGMLNTIAIILAVLVGFLLSLKIKTMKKEEKNVDELSILQKALSSDEKKLIEEIKKAGEITQAVLIALAVVFILSLASVYGQSNSKNMMANGNMGSMMNGMDMDSMDDMMKDMGMSDEMIQECQNHMKSGKMGDMMNGMMGSGMSQEEHESHHK